MKTASFVLAAVVILAMLAGCKARTNTGMTSSTGYSSSSQYSDTPRVSSSGEPSSSQEVSMAEDSSLDVSSEDESSTGDDTSMSAGDFSELTDESVASAMSTDFGKLASLDGTKLEWGSGGPTDQNGRSNGAVAYQKKYGAYDALFIGPETNKIYLTFDEGYENSYTSKILDTLKEQEVSAVFFVTLPYVKSEPELVRRMIAEGHILGNHSSKHLSFPDMPLQEAAKDILQLHEYVKENFNYEMKLFRFPMGHFNEQTLALVQSLGYKSVFWSFAYLDYNVKAQPLTIEALTAITDKSHPGGIYLLHAVSKTNAEVLSDAIDAIREKGLSIAKWDL